VQEQKNLRTEKFRIINENNKSNDYYVSARIIKNDFTSNGRDII
jgi:hypothetical protein